jgi:hypothetical protein
MAILKVFVIRHRVDKRMAYALDPAKTSSDLYHAMDAPTAGAAADVNSVDHAIAYAMDPEKTESSQILYQSAINCSVQNAARAFIRTKEEFGKLDKRLAYHYIQSFLPGETTPEQAHQIGVDWAQGLFGAEYEAAIGTHLDHAHIHNHIIVNAVSFVDGHKLHYGKAEYLRDFRGLSDRLCEKNGLSVVPPKGRGKRMGVPYAEWKAAKEERPTLRKLVAQDIDEFIEQAGSMYMFLKLMKQAGYRIDDNPRRKYITVTPPGSDRAIRLTEKSMRGYAYSDAGILSRIEIKRDFHRSDSKRAPLPLPKKRYKSRAQRPYRKKGLTGFWGQYYRYVRLLRTVRNKAAPAPVRGCLYKESLKLDRYIAAYTFLSENKIVTEADLTRCEKNLIHERSRLFFLQNRLKQGTEKDGAGIEEYSAQIQKIYADLRQVKHIKKNTEAMRPHARQAGALKQAEREDRQADVRPPERKRKGEERR